jgi:hypothetical protein
MFVQNLKTERIAGTNGIVIAMGEQDNRHIHHRWVPQMISRTIFSYCTFTFHFNSNFDTVWRFGQQIFPTEFCTFQRACSLGVYSGFFHGKAYVLFEEPAFVGKTVHLSPSHEAVNFTPYLQFEI